MIYIGCDFRIVDKAGFL